MKYVFFDIDGTIRGKSREITKRNKEAICKLRENGHKAFLCTGCLLYTSDAADE